MLTIHKLFEKDHETVKDFVINIENNEFNLAFEPHEQPDLYNLESFYKDGGFWIARYNNKIVATVGLQRLKKGIGIMRHLFVHKEFRGKQIRVAQRMLRQLLTYAQLDGYSCILAGTPEIAVASQRFLLRNGFAKIDDNPNLPKEYKHADRNSKFYNLPVLSTLF